MIVLKPVEFPDEHVSALRHRSLCTSIATAKVKPDMEILKKKPWISLPCMTVSGASEATAIDIVVFESFILSS